MTSKKPVYTREFKMAILSQVNSGIPVTQVARENGLHPSLVFRWRQLYLDNPDLVLPSGLMATSYVSPTVIKGTGMRKATIDGSNQYTRDRVQGAPSKI